jgi:hypothetical protein
MAGGAASVAPFALERKVAGWADEEAGEQVQYGDGSGQLIRAFR